MTDMRDRRLRPLLSLALLALTLLTLALLILLALTHLPVAVVATLHLVHAEGLVHHFLLASHDLAELVHLLAKFAVLLPLLTLPTRLQVVHHVLKLRQQFLRPVAIA